MILDGSPPWLHWLLPFLLPLFKGNYPFFRHFAAGPRPLHSTSPVACRSRSTRRTMSRLTPGQRSSSWATENSSGNCRIAANTWSVLAPRGAFVSPTRSASTCSLIAHCFTHERESPSDRSATSPVRVVSGRGRLWWHSRRSTRIAVSMISSKGGSVMKRKKPVKRRAPGRESKGRFKKRK